MTSEPDFRGIFSFNYSVSERRYVEILPNLCNTHSPLENNIVNVVHLIKVSTKHYIAKGDQLAISQQKAS